MTCIQREPLKRPAVFSASTGHHRHHRRHQLLFPGRPVVPRRRWSPASRANMYYKNPFTGRLAPTTFQVPTKVGAPVVETPVTYTAGTVFPKEQLGPRNAVPSFLLEKMKHFQAPNNVPIHLKGGPVDKMLFGTTLVLCAVGLGGCFQFFYEMAFPPKND